MKSIKLYLVAIVGSVMFNSLPTYSQTIIAHRGASYLAPENTLASVKLGFEHTDHVEIDIHLTKDKRIVVNHDHTTARTAPNSDFVIRETSSDSLRTLEVGNWKNEKYKGEKIPFLEEVFEVVPEGKKLVIEVKDDTAVLPFLKVAVEESGKKDQFILISFNKEAVVQWKKLMPKMPVLWLLHSFDQYTLEDAITIAKENEMEGLNVFYKLINPQFMDTMVEAGLKVYVYTVNDGEIALGLKEAGVDGITTDRPLYIKDILK